MTRWNHLSTGDEVVEAFKEQVHGKTIVITGAGQGGIGAETAFALAKGSPALLVLAGRTKSKVDPVISELKTCYPTVAVKFVHIDLGSKASVCVAAAAINGTVERIDLLINNAAIMACPFALNEDGIESQFATNHLGHFLLTKLLMPNILNAGNGARIVAVSSSTHESGMVWSWDFEGGKTYNEWAAYGQSKLANAMFARTLARRLKERNIFSFSLHPGSISTGLQVHINRDEVVAKAMAAAAADGREFIPPTLKTLQQGCATTLVAALDPSIEGESGAYLVDADIAQLKATVTVEDEKRLWDASEKLLGEKFGL